MPVRDLTAINGTDLQIQNSSHCYQVCGWEAKEVQTLSVISVPHPLWGEKKDTSENVFLFLESFKWHKNPKGKSPTWKSKQ